MVKIYDMVAYGTHAPDETASPYGYETPQVLQSPALQLQTLQLAPTPRAETLPPALRTADIDCFLDSCGN